jgi:tartrate-resistant acid phosphatase type 5
MQWPFKQWGADLVLGGHDHDYEHIEVDGLAYVVMGLGGASEYQLGDPVPGSLVRFDKNFGAVLLTAEPNGLTVEFFTVDKLLIDRFIVKPRS